MLSKQCLLSLDTYSHSEHFLALLFHCQGNVVLCMSVFAEDTMGKKVLIPVPVPIYVPAPMHMYSSPYPVPVPFPLPVPVPIFIPTTRNSAHGIMKEIKVSVPFLFVYGSRSTVLVRLCFVCVQGGCLQHAQLMKFWC